jgi:hypothetical protein
LPMTSTWGFSSYRPFLSSNVWVLYYLWDRDFDSLIQLVEQLGPVLRLEKPCSKVDLPQRPPSPISLC